MKQLATSNNVAQAILFGADKFPVNTKDDDVKAKIAQTWAFIFPLADKATISKTVEQANEVQRANILKYVCRCMQEPEKKLCDNLLVWHSEIYKKDGVGVIQRVLIDRKV